MEATYSRQETFRADNAVRFIEEVKNPSRTLPADTGIGYLPARRDPRLRRPTMPGDRAPSGIGAPMKKVINVLSAIALGKDMRSFLMDMEPMERAEYYVLNKVSDGYQEAFETFNDYALSTKAQFFLGIMYLQGLGVDVDPAKAFECMENAYKGKNINAAFYLGKMYLEGIGVKKTVYKAVDFFKEAARYEDHRAELELGKLYLENKDVACDKEKAAKWMLKSAQHGNPEAQFIMGQLYKTGTGVKSDSALAVEWLERAANKGHKGAQILLGNIYRNGEGVQISRSEAEYWYAVADGKRPLRRSPSRPQDFSKKENGGARPLCSLQPYDGAVVLEVHPHGGRNLRKPGHERQGPADGHYESRSSGQPDLPDVELPSLGGALPLRIIG